MAKNLFSALLLGGLRLEIPAADLYSDTGDDEELMQDYQFPDKT